MNQRRGLSEAGRLLDWIGRGIGMAVMLWALGALRAQGATAAVATNTTVGDRADRALERYFRAETRRIQERTLTGIASKEDWETKRGEYRRQLQEMLGLWPMPAKTELAARVAGREEEADFAVERIHFQSMPGLYVTANFYLPKGVRGKAPAILYVCGHSLVKTNGVSYGNKVGYQHHGIWFARHGYACLVMDTLQLGEIEGLHHGTHREGMWWWNSRGYTPAGVEAWNGIRALDYLQSRPEVDGERIGMTGRSGGGSYTWTTAALDERVRVAAPVAGMTDLENQVVDGCVDGHCDCMFFVNTYRWDFALNAALMAPRPLLIVNTDADSIFPLDGVVRIHRSVRRIYDLYGAGEKLGLVIGPGPHKDTQDLQVPVFRWMDQRLRGEDRVISKAADVRMAGGRLKVFETLPEDAWNRKAHERFVGREGRSFRGEDGSARGLAQRLRAKSFAGWPADGGQIESRMVKRVEANGVEWQRWVWSPQENVELTLFVAQAVGSGATGVKRVDVRILDESEWRVWSGAVSERVKGLLGTNEIVGGAGTAEAGEWGVSSGVARVWVTPRGVGLDRWTMDGRREVGIRRRFMLLGQTVESMRVWDVRRAMQWARGNWVGPEVEYWARASGVQAVNLLYAGLYEPGWGRLVVSGMPMGHTTGGPDYLNVLRVTDVPEVLGLVRREGLVEVTP